MVRHCILHCFLWLRKLSNKIFTTWKLPKGVKIEQGGSRKMGSIQCQHPEVTFSPVYACKLYIYPTTNDKCLSLIEFTNPILHVYICHRPVKK